MKKNRVLIIALTFIMLFSFCCFGCGSKEDDAKENSDSFTQWNGVEHPWDYKVDKYDITTTGHVIAEVPLGETFSKDGLSVTLLDYQYVVDEEAFKKHDYSDITWTNKFIFTYELTNDTDDGMRLSIGCFKPRICNNTEENQRINQGSIALNDNKGGYVPASEWKSSELTENDGLLPHQTVRETLVVEHPWTQLKEEPERVVIEFNPGSQGNSHVWETTAKFSDGDTGPLQQVILMDVKATKLQ